MDVPGSIKLDKGAASPLYLQLAEYILGAIENGHIAAYEKLPSIRRLSKNLGVNSSTVVAAYKHLENKQVLYSHVGKGTFVSGRADLNNSASLNLKMDSVFFDFKNAVNFAKSTVSTEFFPVSAFKDAFLKVLDRDSGEAFSYHEVMGYPPLRNEICKNLLKHGITAEPNEIQVISGVGAGLDIISGALICPGDVIVMENPALYSNMGSLHSKGARIVAVDMETDGMDMVKLESVLKSHTVRFICISSYFQTPTGYCYSEQKKQKLLELACKYSAYIIEEDSYSEPGFYNNMPLPIKALDYNERVLFVKSYGKSVLPGINLTVLVTPGKLIAADLLVSEIPNGFIQRAYELFLASGEYDKHMENMRQLFKTRLNVALHCINEKLSDYVKYTSPPVGLSIWLKLRDENISVEVLSQKLLNENVIITPGALYHMESKDIPYFRLSLAGVSEKDIEFGINKIADCMQKITEERLS